RLVRQVNRAVGAQRDRLVEGTHRGLWAHRHGDDLFDLGLAALANLHRGLDAVRVEGVQVLLAGAIEPLRVRVDPLLNGGVRDLLDETADLQVVSPSGEWRPLEGTGAAAS